MLGIKDSVEDVSSMFKHMALLKPQTSAWSIFSEKTQERDETPLSGGNTVEQAVEFTFGVPASALAPNPVPHLELLISPVTNKPKATARKKRGEISEDQLLLFKIA